VIVREFYLHLPYITSSMRRVGIFNNIKYWNNIHCIKILNNRCPLSLRRDRGKDSQKIQSLQNISPLLLQKTVQWTETSDSKKAKLFVRRNVYMCTNAPERRCSFAWTCPLRNYMYSLQPGIFNICSGLAEESCHKIHSSEAARRNACCRWVDFV